jgi:ATP-dependent exoDNAse (exonuclease V) beta subunit
MTVSFTEHQNDAIDVSQREANACVVAGPGSGKTTVLVEYFSRLVAAGVDPGRILAITFTEKAAGNMRAKLADAWETDRDLRARLERAWVSTVHGFCARLLKENAVFAGVDPDFSVADERESWRMQQESIAAAVTALFTERHTAVQDLIRGLSSYNFEEAVLSAYDAMRGAGMTVEDVAATPPPPGVSRDDLEAAIRELAQDPLHRWKPEQKLYCRTIVEQATRILEARDPREALGAIANCSISLTKCKRDTPAYELVRRLRDQLIDNFEYSLISELYARERELLLEILCRFDRIYRDRKRQAGALDFADLEEFAVRLLREHPETRARIQAQFDHILMDEFQDTNGQQACLLELVRRPGRFYAVGDINQSIFGFRHAEPRVFRDYRDRVSRRIELDDNFRSRPAILRAIETIIYAAPGIEPRPLVAARAFDEPREICVEAIAAVAPQSDDALALEARWVARRILELVQEGRPPFAFRDVAVLVRNTEVLPDFTDAFDGAGIPYVVNRGRGFYDAREVNDLTQLLRVIANPRDEVSLAAVLRSPLVQVSDEALLRLRTLGDNIGVSLLHLGTSAEADFDAEDFRKLIRFRDRLRGWRLHREQISFDRLLLAALDDCGYPAEPGTRASANIEKFLAQIRRAAPRLSLDELVEELALIRESNPREPDAPPDDSANAVNVMTVHSAKGLEFPIVFVSALHKGIETSPPVVAFSKQFGIGARWRNPATGEEKDDLVQHAIREERNRREEEESNRLLYVAMTRAEQHLVLTLSVAGKKRENWVKQLQANLPLALDQPCDEIIACHAPDGKPWKLGLRVVDHPPEALPRPQLVETPPVVERIAAPAAAGQQDANATVTAIASFAKCPHEYFLGHYLGFEGKPRRLEDSEELAAAELGTQVHALLAGAPVGDPDPEALRLAEVFRQSPLGRRAARAARVEREFDFLMAFDDLVLRGQVDLWFEEGGELTIVDYKTDAVTAVEAHERALDYAMQLRLYALAVERVTGRAPRHAWLHFLRPNTAIEIDLTPSLLDSPEQMVRDFQEAQSRLEFPLVEADHCRRCQFFRDLCPSTYHREKRPGQ